jgi:hypothetical protein
MTTYTLHLPSGAQPGQPSGLDGALLVKDGFSWGAFLFTFLWFFAHRLWLAGLAVLVGLAVLSVALVLLQVHGAMAGAVMVLAMILVGLEAGTLRRWTYGRRGSPALDVVTAETLDEAEAKAFARWLQRSDPAPSPPVPSPAPVPSFPQAGRRPETVIGMFPDAERPR